MITARQLIFYIRAEDQASRVVRRAARSFGSLNNIRQIEIRAAQQQLKNLNNIEKAQQRIRSNAESIARAQVAASRTGRFVAAGRPLKGFTMDETVQIHEANLQRVRRLSEQERLLAKDLNEVRRSGDAASASLDRELNSARIARTEQYVNSIQSIARAMRLVGVAALAGFGFAANTAANFGTQVTLAASQARRPGAPATQTLKIQKNLQDEILKQVQQFPASSQEMADSFYQIFSGTNIQNVKQAAQYVKLFNEAAVGGGASLAEMTQAGITIKNVFGVGLQGEFKNMTEALNVFFSAVRYGRMTASQFAEALSYITPIAKDVHLSFRNVAEDMAFFTRQTGGRMTRQDAQGLARLIQLFSRDDVVQGLAQRGIPVFDKLTGRMRPVVDIIKQIHDQLRLTPQETVNFFKTISAAGSGKQGTQGTIQAIRIFSQGIQNAKAYEDVVKNVRQDNNEFVRSFEALSKSPGVQWKVFLNQFKALVLVIGREAIPAFVTLAQPIVALLHWFNQLDEGTKHTIATVGVFSSAAAVIGGTLLIVIGAFAKLVLTIRLLRLESLASETGSVTAKFALWSGILGAVLLILIKYPGLVHRIVDAMGGLKGVLIAISTLGVAATLLKISGAMTTVGNEAVVSAGKVSLLRTRLLKLSALAIPAIVIPVSLKVSDDLSKGIKPGEPVAHYHKGFLGTLQKIGSGIEYYSDYITGRVMGKSKHDATEAARKATIGDVGSTLYLGPQSALDNLVKIDKNPLTPDPVKLAAHAAFARGDYKTVERIAKMTAGFKIATDIKPYDINTVTVQKLAGRNPVIKQANWQGLFANVIKLDKALSDGRVHSVAQYKELLDAEEKLQKASTGNQYQAAMQYLSDLESTWNKATSAAKKAAANMDKATKADLNKRLKVIVNLRRQYEKIPNIANHKRYFDALTKLNKDYASKASQDYIKDYLKKVDAADKKRLQTIKENMQNARTEISDLVSGVQSLYDNLLQQEQTNFGQLFQGPVITDARVQDNLQFGGHITALDTLKDLKGQVFQYQRFNRQLDELSSRGAPKKFVDALRALGPEARDNIKVLNQLTPAQFREYIATWNKGQALIKKNTETQLNAQLKIYYSFGRKIARQILKGVQSEDQALQNELQNIVLKLFPGLAKQAKLAHKAATKSTSTVKSPQLSTTGHSTRTTQSAITTSTTSIKSQHNGTLENHRHYHFEGIDNRAELETKLRHAEFISRNKYKGNE